MKRLIRILILVLLVLCCIALVQCRDDHTEPGNTTVPSTSPQPTETAPTGTQAPATQPPETEIPTTQATEPPVTEPEFLYFNPLTGEGLKEFSENRPYAIIFNNVKAAQPQHGVGQADILCEMMTEGGTTRCLGIFYDLEDVEAFGSIRSARPYFVNLARSFDAIFVHAGRSDEAKDLLNSTGYDHIDGVHGKGASKYFYRDQDRLAAGYATEHTMFITPESIIAYATKMGCTLTRKDGVSYGWTFSEEVPISGETANTITARFTLGNSTSSRNKYTTMHYNADTGLYEAEQYGGAYIDAETGNTLAFRNVLILRASSSKQDDAAGHLTIKLTGSGTGYYACGGTLIPIKWSRSSNSAPFVFTTEDGTPLTLSVGKTYMGFVSTKSQVTYE